MAGSAISRRWRKWSRGSPDHEAGVPLSPASGDAALAAGRADPVGAGGGLPGPRSDGKRRSRQDHRPALAHGRRHADPRPDDRPLHRSPVDGETAAGQSPRAGRPLGLLSPGRPDGGDGLCDGARRRPAGDRVRRLRRTAAPKLRRLSSSCTSALPCIISSSDGTDCCDGWASGVGCKLATWPHGPSTCQVT